MGIEKGGEGSNGAGRGVIGFVARAEANAGGMPIPQVPQYSFCTEVEVGILCIESQVFLHSSLLQLKEGSRNLSGAGSKGTKYQVFLGTARFHSPWQICLVTARGGSLSLEDEVIQSTCRRSVSNEVTLGGTHTILTVVQVRGA